uniref:Putative secreted protein n=1 Tax=Ixodes ricinus TaxID=34613 RepID=A0A6B0UDN7_IXORI
MRCLCASVLLDFLYGCNSSAPKPGIHMFQFFSRLSWTSLVSRVVDFLCFARRQDVVTTFSMNSSAICNKSSSTSSSSCSLGSTSLTRSWSLCLFST